MTAFTYFAFVISLMVSVYCLDVPKPRLMMSTFMTNGANLTEEEISNEVQESAPPPCPSYMTLCKIACCPVASAVCCDDGKHCCPASYTCNFGTRGCTWGGKMAPFMETVTFLTEEKVSNEVQETGIQCASHMTKCGNGCCPVASAVCCSDGVNCCPGGFTCNYAAGGCTRGFMMSPFMAKVAYLTEEKVSNEVQESAPPPCPSFMTQCKNACCPVESGVCCSDGIHCCPAFYICNLNFGECAWGGKMSPSMENATFLTEEKVSSINSTISNEVQESAPPCPSYMTLCEIACCPVASGVCCEDGRHCCPTNYTCNLAFGVCNWGGMISPFMETVTFLTEEKVSSEVKEAVPVSQCPSYMTQCGAGCCPLRSAVCCSDGVHCCPHGYTCNLALGKCTKGRMMSLFLKKIMF